jgi:RNA polymerase sigma factor (sigma-70 family)
MSENPGTKIRNNLDKASKVFNMYGDEIRAMIRFNTKNEAETDDIFQDFFLSVVDKPIPQNIQDVRGYLYKAITNDIIDVSRRTKSHRDRDQKYAECRKYSIVEEDPSDLVVQAENIQKIFGIIERRLPKREAEVVIKRFGGDLNTRDTAKYMQVNRRTVSRYLSLAIRKMRELVHKDKDGDDFL